MLKKRVLTAVILLAVLIPALLAANPIYFAAAVWVLVVLAVWEWGRLLGVGAVVQNLFAAAVGGVIVALWWAGLNGQALQQWATPIAMLTVVCWLVMLVLSLPKAKVPQALMAGVGRVVHLLFAALTAVAAWMVVTLTHAQGWLSVLTLLLIVWIADTAAYFTGKAFGRRKLAPSISPNKTWEGAVGGVVGASLFGAACSQLTGTFFVMLSGGMSWRAFLLTALIAAVSVAGDLYESLLKRQADVKDSSQLLPGHGGVLDRVDALLPSLPLAWVLARL
jgi:phosphatidate cytidylyltransferase